jgi:hypothetical protein
VLEVVSLTLAAQYIQEDSWYTILFEAESTPEPWQSCILTQKQKTKQTPWPLVHKPTIPTERLPLVGEI